MPHLFARLLIAITLLAALTAAPQLAQAQDTGVITPIGPQAPPPVTVRENFSPFELTTIGLSAAGAITLIGFGEHIFGAPAPGMGPPDPQSVDWRYTHHVNVSPDPSKQWLGGAPDLAGYLLPALAVSVYGTGSLGHALCPERFKTSQTHELLAFTEAFAWTMLTTNALKLMVGRQRPFTVRPDLDADAFGENEREYNISFPSGHSASAAAVMTFVFWDLSDHLVHTTLADAHPALRYSLGYMAPLAATASITWGVMYSRIRDQRHWLSDTITGALIGVGFSSLFYTLHFDDTGAARRRHTVDADTPARAIQRVTLSPTVTMQGPGLSYGFVF